MPQDAWDVLLNLLAAAISGSAVWTAQRFVVRRRLRRTRRFFGLAAGGDCLLVVNRHASSPNDHSVHRNDVVALLTLSGLLRTCGARPEVLFHDQAPQSLNGKTEFCIGGPTSNRRTSAHLRHGLPGVTTDSNGDGPRQAIQVGDATYAREPDTAEYAVVAKIVWPGQERPAGRPVFLIFGQTSIANQAAVGYLVANHRRLARAHGLDGRFCLVLRVLDPSVYGATMVELAGDATAHAFTPPPETGEET